MMKLRAKNCNKMALTLNLFVTIAVSFITELDGFQTVADVDNPSLSPLLTIPPYYSFLGYEKPVSLCDTHDQRLKQIADLYDFKITDLYQLYDLVSSNLPSASPDTYVSMIQQLVEASQIERIRRGMVLPENFPQYPSPIVRPQINNPLYTLQRRDVSDIAENLYQDTTSAAKNLYNNAYNMVNYSIPENTQAFKNQISDIVDEFSPSQILDSAENFASKLQENLRYMLSSVV